MILKKFGFNPLLLMQGSYMHTKKITIIVPTFNRSEAIKECLNSISYQDFKCRVQLIVVDDGSDETESIVRQFQNKNFAVDVTYIKNTTRLGLSKSRNLGLSLASGDLIIPLDSDNVLLKNAFIKILAIHEANSCVDFYFFKSKFKSGINNYSCAFEDFHMDFDAYLSNLPLGEYLPVLTRNFVDLGFRYDEGVWGYEGLLWARALKAKCRLYLSSAAVQLYDDVSANRLSTITKDQAKNRVYGLQKYLSEFSVDLQRANPIHLQRLAENYLVYYKISKIVDLNIALDVRKHFNYSTRAISALIFYAPSFLFSCIFPLLVKIRKRT